MKQRIAAGLRGAGLLESADWVRYRSKLLLTARDNRRFIEENSDFPLPPLHFLYETAGSPSYRRYQQQGAHLADVFWGHIGRHVQGDRLCVCEWGCGVGRIIRHLRAASQNRVLQVFGLDYNRSMIEWCRSAIPHVEFGLNGLMPPTGLQQAAFDAAYCFSVFTHLAEAAQRAWVGEIARIVKPGGVFVFTTLSYRNVLLPAEQRTFDAGELVVRDSPREGGRTHVAYASPKFVREKLMAGHEILQHIPVSASQVGQDLWIARLGVQE